MPRPKFDLLIFDLDGTLVDSQKDLADSVNHIRSYYDRPALELGLIRSFVGNGVTPLIKKSLPELHGSEIKKATDLFREYYRGHLLDSTVLYPGVKNMLESTCTRPKAVLTNKPEAFARTILEGLGIIRDFKVVWGGDTGPERKPSPGPLIEITRMMGAAPDKCIMIGDGINDILSAKAAGTRSGAVGYGYTKKDELVSHNPDYYFPDAASICDIC